MKFEGKRFRFTRDHNGARVVTRGKVRVIDDTSVRLTGGTSIPREQIVEVNRAGH